MGPLDLVAIVILRSLLKTESGNRYIDIIMDRFSKLTKPILTTSATVTRIANIFMKQCVASFRLPFTVLTDNGPYFTSKFFTALRMEIRLKTVTTTEYHLQDNGKVERFNRAIT